MSEESLASELSGFGKIVNISFAHTDFETQVIIIMAHKSEAMQVSDFLQKKYRFNVQLEDSSSSSYQMRELWVGNLSSTITQEKLSNRFFIYGELEVIYMFMYKNFAFVRFKEVAAAIRALEAARGIKIDGRSVKLSFADPIRRKEALGDLPGYKFSMKNAKGLVMKYNGTTVTPQEDFIKGLLGKYGNVKALLVGEVGFKPNIRPRVFVEFANHVNRLIIE